MDSDLDLARAAFARTRELDARAVRLSVDLVAQADGGDWSRPSTCAGWTLGDLLAHLTAQHRGFAAAADGAGFDLDPWAVLPAGPDRVADYREAAEQVLAAFARVTEPEQGFALPEITTAGAVPARTAVGFHLIDYLVHSWDLAATLGLPFDPDPELVAAGLPIALAVPGGSARLAPGAAFAPALGAPDDTATMDRILLILGRDPGWKAPVR